MGCGFCKIPCGQDHCPYTPKKREVEEAIRMTRSIIQSPNHAFYNDRLRIINHLERLYARLNKQQKE